MAPGDGKGQEGEGQQKPPLPDTPKMFTQEEVNNLMGKTRGEERSKFADYDKLKSDAAELQKIRDGQRTEKEKLTEQLSTAERKRVDAEARVADTAIRSEVRVLAAQRGVDPDAAIALIDRSKVTYAEDKGVEGVAAALDALLEAKPFLKVEGDGKRPAPKINSGGGKPSNAVTLNADELAAAQKLGVKPEAYANKKSVAA